MLTCMSETRGMHPLRVVLQRQWPPMSQAKLARALEMIPNTAPFDVSGHPAMNVPCARSEGLPVGLMLVGRQWEDATVLRAAHAFEQLGDYSVRPEPAAGAVSAV